MKLSDWAKKQGISYHTAWNLFKSGKLPVEAIQLETGTILINDDKNNINLSLSSCRLEIIDKNLVEDELKNDLMSIVSYFCHKIYGLKEGNSKINNIKEILD